MFFPAEGSTKKVTVTTTPEELWTARIEELVEWLEVVNNVDGFSVTAHPNEAELRTATIRVDAYGAQNNRYVKVTQYGTE